MNLTKQDISIIRSALAAARLAGVEQAVIGDGAIRGAAVDQTSAIISPLPLSLPPELKIGIGRLTELEKRISLFGPDLEIEVVPKDEKSVQSLELSEKRTKISFRCAAATLISTPKGIADEAVVALKLTAEEAQQLVKTVKTLGAEAVAVVVGKAGNVRFTGMSPANEKFAVEIEASAECLDEQVALTASYKAPRFCQVLEAAAKLGDVEPTIGAGGTFAITLDGHLLVLIAESEGDEE